MVVNDEEIKKFGQPFQEEIPLYSAKSSTAKRTLDTTSLFSVSRLAKTNSFESVRSG